MFRHGEELVMIMATGQQIAVQPRRWTKQEYYRLGEMGFFRGQKVELIEGELMVHAPQNPAHADRLDRVGDALRAAFGRGYRVRCQLPLDLGQPTEPEPDYAVVTDQNYQAAHPTGAELIVEVADSSLDYDRDRKGSLYACSGIRDYWIVNLVQNQVEVYRDPVPDPSAPHGWRYSSRTDLHPGDSVSPLARPQSTVAIAGLLP
jgi:Uma2 family endonuclease